MKKNQMFPGGQLNPPPHFITLRVAILYHSQELNSPNSELLDFQAEAVFHFGTYSAGGIPSPI